MKKKLNQVKTFFSKPYNILLVLFLIVLTYLVVFPLFSIVKDTFIVQHSQCQTAGSADLLYYLETT